MDVSNLEVQGFNNYGLILDKKLDCTIALLKFLMKEFKDLRCHLYCKKSKNQGIRPVVQITSPNYLTDYFEDISCEINEDLDLIYLQCESGDKVYGIIPSVQGLAYMIKTIIAYHEGQNVPMDIDVLI